MPLVFAEDGRRNDGTLFIARRGPRTAKGFHDYQRIFGSKFSPGPALNVMGSLIEHFTRMFLEEKSLQMWVREPSAKTMGGWIVFWPVDSSAHESHLTLGYRQ